MTRIVIIGGGPAGYEAALVAAQHGASVSLIDSDGIGGACVLFDCVPSKTFIASTGIRTDMRRATDLGIELDPAQATVALPQIHSRVKSLARPSRPTSAPGSQTVGRRSCYSGRGRTDRQPAGYGRAQGPRQRSHTGEEKVLDADVVLIATGASPRDPAGRRAGRRAHPHVASAVRPRRRCPSTWSSSVPVSPVPSSCPRTPRSGVKVTLVSSRDRVLPHEDEDAALVLEDVLAERGVTLVKHARADTVERTEDGVASCSPTAGPSRAATR